MCRPREPVPSQEGLGGIPVGVRLALGRWGVAGRTVGGPRAPLPTPARGLPSVRSCAQFGRLQGTHESPWVSVVFAACSLLVVNGVQ